MQWVSTRGSSPPVSFLDALFAGTAPDGGLYMPEQIEPLPARTLCALRDASLVEIGTVVGAHLLEGEITVDALRPLLEEALNFAVPLKPLNDSQRKGIFALELFHGPTLAFKDVGARVQARLLHHFTDGSPLTILVATSGDTGSAVAQAFYRVPDTRVIVLYPEGQVSDAQEAQMASLGENIFAVAVDGTFDDCQQLVKQAFADRELRKRVWLTPANSINLGRLLPQVFYYFLTAIFDEPPIISVPSGNIGNLTAGLIAKRLGLPVRKFVAATNANSVVPDYLRTGKYQPRPSIRTIANAMDVGAPSNFERVNWLYNNCWDALSADVSGYSFQNDEISAAIRDVYCKQGYMLDPHGAVGWLGLNKEISNSQPSTPGVFLVTAHAAKFADIVKAAIKADVPVPPVFALNRAVSRERYKRHMKASYSRLLALLGETQ